jgi:hypothetical protein
MPPRNPPFFYLFDILDEVGEKGLGIFRVFWGQNVGYSNIITGAEKILRLIFRCQRQNKFFRGVNQRI